MTLPDSRMTVACINLATYGQEDFAVKKWLRTNLDISTPLSWQGDELLKNLVPPVGIEPTPDDYKSTARPSCYGGGLKRAVDYSGSLRLPRRDGTPTARPRIGKRSSRDRIATYHW